MHRSNPAGRVVREDGALASKIRIGLPVSDAEFDRVYPDWVRRASDMHWTPYAVARRAAELLVVDSTTRVLDVGSGPGKVCLIGSLATDGLFFGVEQREGLIEASEQAAHRCGATRAHFIHGDAMSLDWGRFDAFYLYNPFFEHVTDVTPKIEESIEHSPELFSRYVRTTTLKLCSAPIGTRVVTYQGYGGTLPAGYQRLVREAAGCDYLELWRKDPLNATLEQPRRQRPEAFASCTE